MSDTLGVAEGVVRTRPRDLPWPTPARLQWRKRRWRCRQPDCPRASFAESIPQLPPRARLTARLRAAAGDAVAVDGRTITQAARELRLSWPTVAAAFTERATALLTALLTDELLAGEPEPVTVLGIDETRRGRPRFAPNPDTGKLEQLADRWHTGFIDLTGGQGLLGQVEGRAATDTGAGWPPRPRPGGPACRWWRSTCPPPTGPPCASTHSTPPQRTRRPPTGQPAVTNLMAEYN